MSVGPNGECMSHYVNTTKQDDSDKFCTGIGIDMVSEGRDTTRPAIDRRTSTSPPPPRHHHHHHHHST